MNRQKNILLLLDEYSPFKDTLYNSIIRLPFTRYKVDLWFHQYNEALFNAILRDSIGRYNKYVVMNFDNEKISPYLYKIDSSACCCLISGSLISGNIHTSVRTSVEAFYAAMAQLSERLQNYHASLFCFWHGKVSIPRRRAIISGSIVQIINWNVR